MHVSYIFAYTKIPYDAITLYKGKVSYKILCLKPGFITLKGTRDLYFELTKVLGITLSCLLHDDFHSCLFL